MSKISNDGLKQLKTNVKNPLESMYNKAQKSGHVKWSDMKDAYDFIYRFLDDVENNWEVTDGENKADPIVLINNKIYKPEQ